MNKYIHTFCTPAFFLSAFFIVTNAGAGSIIDVLSTPQSGYAASIAMSCNAEIAPIAKSKEATEWYASLIFNNDQRRPQISATQGEIEQWVNTASSPFVETYSVQMAWAPNSCSMRRICGPGILCPVGRDMYVATDKTRLVEHSIEGDYKYFGIRNMQPGLIELNSEIWAQPNGQILLWPLAWFHAPELKLVEKNTPDGQTIVHGTTDKIDTRLLEIWICTNTDNPTAIKEIRYIYNNLPDGGPVLVEGILSGHQELSNEINFPQDIIWTTRNLTVNDTIDLSQPVTFDPTLCKRCTYHVQSMTHGNVDELFPNGFLPAAPQDVSKYIDTRYPRGDAKRVDSSLVDYRQVQP